MTETLLDTIGQTPRLATLGEAQGNFIVTCRLWVTLRKRGLNPSAAVADRIGCPRAAMRFWLLMEEVGAAWPDPFVVSPPCCPRLSFDEATLLQVIEHAAAGDRAGVMRLLAEMLPIELSDRLYGAARGYLTAIPTA